MAETLAVRVTRILAGSAHAFLDVLEDMAPEAMMRQAVREIDQVMGEVRVDLGKAEAAKHLITSQINKLNTESEQLAAHIETALEARRRRSRACRHRAPDAHRRSGAGPAALAR